MLVFNPQFQIELEDDSFLALVNSEALDGEARSVAS